MQATISSTYLESTATCSGCSHCRDLAATNSATDPPALTAQRNAAKAFMLAAMLATPAGPAAASSAPLSGAAIAGIAGGGAAAIAVVAGVAVFGARAGWWGGGRGGRQDRAALLAG